MPRESASIKPSTSGQVTAGNGSQGNIKLAALKMSKYGEYNCVWILDGGVVEKPLSEGLLWKMTGNTDQDTVQTRSYQSSVTIVIPVLSTQSQRRGLVQGTCMGSRSDSSKFDFDALENFKPGEH